MYYKRGFEFKLPYPCLYDFESNFGASTGLNGYNDKTPSHNGAESASSGPKQAQPNSGPTKTNKSLSSTASSSSSNSSSPLPTKTKSTKYNKAQLIQQRAQQHAQQQLQLHNSAHHLQPDSLQMFHQMQHQHQAYSTPNELGHNLAATTPQRTSPRR